MALGRRAMLIPKPLPVLIFLAGGLMAFLAWDKILEMFLTVLASTSNRIESSTDINALSLVLTLVSGVILIIVLRGVKLMIAFLAGFILGAALRAAYLVMTGADIGGS